MRYSGPGDFGATLFDTQILVIFSQNTFLKNIKTIIFTKYLSKFVLVTD